MAKLTGTNPDQVPTNADLGTMAYQDSTNTVLENAYINAKGADGLEMGEDYTSPNNSSRLFFNSNTAGGNWAIFNNSGGLKFQSGAAAGSTSGNYTSVALSTTGMVLGGNVTMPNQPAFSVTRNSTAGNLAANTLTTLSWATEIFDQSGNFSGTTFTAPVTGKYHLSTLMRWQQVDSAAAYIDLRFVTTNRSYQWIFAPDDDLAQDADFMNVSASVLADMDEGDTASMTLYISGGANQMDIEQGSHFFGYLVA